MLKTKEEEIAERRIWQGKEKTSKARERSQLIRMTLVPSRKINSEKWHRRGRKGQEECKNKRH